MLLNNLRTAIRNLRKFWVFALINVSGLTLATVVVIVVGLMLRDGHCKPKIYPAEPAL